MTGATHESAVAILTSLERFVRIVAEREVSCMINNTCSSTNVDKSPKLSGMPKPYTVLYNANVGTLKKPLCTENHSLPSAVNSNFSTSPPKPAPRKFTPSSFTNDSGGESEYPQV